LIVAFAGCPLLIDAPVIRRRAGLRGIPCLLEFRRLCSFSRAV